MQKRKTQLIKQIEKKKNFTSAATKLLSKRKELYEAFEELQKQRHIYNEEEKRLKEREQKINIEDEKIQTDLEKFCRFIKNNESKKQRAEAKIQQEKLQIEQKKQQLEQLNKEIEQQKDYNEKMTKKIESLSKCENFLKKVVLKYPDQYQDIEDLLQRYKNLQNSIQMLEKRAEKIKNDYKDAQNEFSNIEKKKTNEILILNINISQLQKDLEDKESKKKEQTSEIESQKRNNFSENLIVARIFMAIDNLYSRCQKTSNNIKSQNYRKKENKENNDENVIKYTKKDTDEIFELEQTCQKLNYVINFMSDLREIVKKEKPK